MDSGGTVRQEHHMNVHLTPELEKLVQNKVKTGRHNSASEVVREALRLMEERDTIRPAQLAELRRRIDAGLASLDRGEGVEGAQFMAQAEERPVLFWPVRGYLIIYRHRHKAIEIVTVVHGSRDIGALLRRIEQ
jgi:antitoxin ParD1/3/4